jgi:predicted DsbA family dithiol-disulfide isomerase
MGASRAAQNEKHLIALAAAEGLTFDFMNGRVGSSMRGHRLLHYTLAKGSGGGSDRDSSDGSDAAAKKQTAVAEALFSAMFEQGKDIGDVQVLVEAAKAAGVEGLEEVRMYLETGEGEEEVRRENVEVREMGVNSVPNFRFSVGDREEVLDGAKDVGEFFEMLISMKEKTAIEQ